MHVCYVEIYDKESANASAATSLIIGLPHEIRQGWERRSCRRDGRTAAEAVQTAQCVYRIRLDWFKFTIYSHFSFHQKLYLEGKKTKTPLVISITSNSWRWLPKCYKDEKKNTMLAEGKGNLCVLFLPCQSGYGSHLEQYELMNLRIMLVLIHLSSLSVNHAPVVHCMTYSYTRRLCCQLVKLAFTVIQLAYFDSEGESRILLNDVTNNQWSHR